MRVVFGGASWRNRFERISLLDCAWVEKCQRAFDAQQQPFPQSVARWAESRARMQSQGVLPDGHVQLWRAVIETYIDDLSGQVLLDRAVVPPC